MHSLWGGSEHGAYAARTAPFRGPGSVSSTRSSRAHGRGLNTQARLRSRLGEEARAELENKSLVSREQPAMPPFWWPVPTSARPLLLKQYVTFRSNRTSRLKRTQVKRPHAGGSPELLRPQQVESAQGCPRPLPALTCALSGHQTTWLHLSQLLDRPLLQGLQAGFPASRPMVKDTSSPPPSESRVQGRVSDASLPPGVRVQVALCQQGPSWPQSPPGPCKWREPG